MQSHPLPLDYIRWYNGIVLSVDSIIHLEISLLATVTHTYELTTRPGLPGRQESLRREVYYPQRQPHAPRLWMTVLMLFYDPGWNASLWAFHCH